MNAQTKIKAASPSYDADGYGWAMAQAQLLRERRFSEIDWDNVIEEIEDVGASHYRTVESALRIILLHHLKWEHQPSRRSRSWVNSIRVHLERYDRILTKHPGLKPSLGEMMDDIYPLARLDASNETGIDIDLFPLDPPSWEHIRAPREL